MTAPRLTVLCGGVGAARMLRALCLVSDPASITAVVNTADDTVLHGLSISPDLDTIVYTLAGAIDPERGWGLAGETWRAMDALGRYEAVRPDGSHAAPTWFNIGDRDLGTHLYRTARLAEGATLTEVTAEICRAWGVDVALAPMTNDEARTKLEIDDEVTIGFQEYFVGLRHDVPIRGVLHDGDCVMTPEVEAALTWADGIVIAPSNPILSIAPIRALDGVDEALAARRDSVVAVSPIVGGSALKGPADRVLTELGHDASVVGVARLYADIAATLVIDPADEHLAADVEAVGMRALVTPSVMSSPEVSASLASAVLAAALGPGTGGGEGLGDAIGD